MSYSLQYADRPTHAKILAVAAAATVAFVVVGMSAKEPSVGHASRGVNGETFFEHGRFNVYARVPTRPASRFEIAPAPQMPLRFAQNESSSQGAVPGGVKRDRLTGSSPVTASSVIIRNDRDLNTTYAAKQTPSIEMKFRKPIVCESPFGGRVTLTEQDVFIRCIAARSDQKHTAA